MFAHKKPGGHKTLARQAIRFESRWSNQDQLVLHEGLRTNPTVACWPFDEADSQFVLEKKVDDLVSVAAVERELEARILLQEGWEWTGDKGFRDRRRCSEIDVCR